MQKPHRSEFMASASISARISTQSTKNDFGNQKGAIYTIHLKRISDAN